MTVRATDAGSVELVGDCASEDAEHLLQALAGGPGAEVDLTACDRAHTAVIQVLMASRATIKGPARGAFLRRWVESQLGGD